MTEEAASNVTRRVAIAAGLAGAAVTAALTGGAGEAHPAAAAEPKRKHEGGAGERLPVVFLPHGGGPWPFVDIGIGSKAEQAELASYLRSVAGLPKTPPKAVAVA